VAKVDEATPSRTGLVGGQLQQMIPGKITLLMAAAARNQKNVAEELLRRGARDLQPARRMFARLDINHHD
jgi:hypothetical protein